jgi:hypothetical protein
MNELVKGLASQARTLAIARSTVAPDICTVGSDYFLEIEREEFVALIVRHCAMIARSTKREADVDGGAVMLKHFVVKS